MVASNAATRTAIRVFSLGLIAAAAAAAADLEKPRLPPDVARLVGPDAVVIDLEAGDVNADGLQDYLLVLENPTDTRDLLIVLRQPNGSLELAGRNKTIIECGVCEGQGGDFRVNPTGDGFDVEDNAGAGDVGRKLQFKFRYVQQEATWILIEVDDERYDGQTTPRKHEKRVQMPYEQGRVIRFDAFRGDEFGVAWSP